MIKPFSAEHPPRSLLVLRLGAVGDVVRTLPAVHLLRLTWPEAKIGWAVETGAAPLLKGHPDIDHVFVLPRGRLVREARRTPLTALKTLTRFVSEIRAFQPELALDFQSSFKSGLTAWLSRAPVRAGFDRPFDREGSHLFANWRISLAEARIHRVDRAVALARAVGANPAPLRADLALSAEELRKGTAQVAELVGARRAVALAPFTSRLQAWKRFPLARWAEVAQALAQAGHAVLVLAGPGEEEEARQLAAAAGPGVIPVEGLTLRELAALIASTDLFVGGDTGPMHIAWAVGVPVVAVYGPTDPVLNAPFGTGHTILAPAARSRRSDPDKFPGITAHTILAPALERLGRDEERETTP